MRWQRLVVHLDRWFRGQSRLSAWLVSIVILGAVGALDYLTGVEVVVNFLYIIPIVIITRRLGLNRGLLISFFGALVCAAVDWIGRPSLSVWLALWNVAGDFAIFAALAVTLARIGRDLAEQKRLNKELQEALAQVKTLSGLLPICAWCKKIRDTSGDWHRLEEYITAHAEVDFTHSICPECREKFHHR